MVPGGNQGRQHLLGRPGRESCLLESEELSYRITSLSFLPHVKNYQHEGHSFEFRHAWSSIDKQQLASSQGLSEKENHAAAQAPRRQATPSSMWWDSLSRSSLLQGITTFPSFSVKMTHPGGEKLLFPHSKPGQTGMPLSKYFLLSQGPSSQVP